MFVVSVVYLITGINLGAPIVNGSIEPSFFPLILGSCAVIFSSVLLFKNFVKNSEIKAKEGNGKGPLHGVSALVFATVVYIGLFATVGYMISSILYVYATIFIFSDSSKLIPKFFISVTIVVIGYLIFEQLFGVRLPTLEV